MLDQFIPLAKCSYNSICNTKSIGMNRPGVRHTTVGGHKAAITDIEVFNIVSAWPSCVIVSICGLKFILATAVLSACMKNSAITLSDELRTITKIRLTHYVSRSAFYTVNISSIFSPYRTISKPPYSPLTCCTDYGNAGFKEKRHRQIVPWSCSFGAKPPPFT